MGNFLVSSVCRAHSSSEAVYEVVRAQVGALRGRQRRGSPLQRRCAAQQAALLRLLSSRMALGAAVMRCWIEAASCKARAALIASLVFIAKKFVATNRPQLLLPPPPPSSEFDDVFDEFHAVFEAAPRPRRNLRRLPPSVRPKEEGDESQQKTEESQQSEETDGKPEESDNNTEEDKMSCTTEQLSDLDDDDYEVLPKLEEDRAFYEDGGDAERVAEERDSNQLEGERLLELASSISDTSMHVEEYIINGKHDDFDVISRDVEEHAINVSEAEKRTILRILLAFCAYSEDASYTSDMVSTAVECLQVWQGDEDRAFKSLAVLCSDVPRLCAALN